MRRGVAAIKKSRLNRDSLFALERCSYLEPFDLEPPFDFEPPLDPAFDLEELFEPPLEPPFEAAFFVVAMLF